MTESPSSKPLALWQRLILLLAVSIFAGLLLFLRGQIATESPLDQMARRSLEPQLALANGRPTLIEFYAEWCEVCQLMAPDMLLLESKFDKQIDFVLLNIDNERWSNFVKDYQVYGVPQMNFFDNWARVFVVITFYDL